MISVIESMRMNKEPNNVKKKNNVRREFPKKDKNAAKYMSVNKHT